MKTPTLDVVETDDGRFTPIADLFDLDVRVHEGPTVDSNLWGMTDDGCGQTCQSACAPSCTARKGT
ncbi:FxLD family lanthipeptide [Nocardiopsis sp. EMB25]|uniref:FxLD family lanthipeptide n=1 Tax=Nocardiopsis sp. EMB25 TaxID=2835867 RepID=UPI00228453D9|nr:FxLD family lanthipeptide [Nocardiopsis sp. EMB25]MCY9783943.1 FxLD family lanthipeptide [Nocardiopsis sp. EMB25]